MSRRFQNQVVLITGASSGIGEAVAKVLFHEGARLVLAARREERLRELAASMGQVALVVKCDVTKEGDLEFAVKSAVEKFGRIDVVFANAGIDVVGRVEELEVEDFKRQFETNVYGVVRTLKAAVMELRKTRGAFVITGSVAGHVAIPGASPYSMSKFAVRALATSLRGELSRDGIDVVLISPGFVKKEIRTVDKQGKFVDSVVEDDRPAWLLMDTDVAARQIVDGIRGRKSEKVITLHGKVGVFLSRLFPRLIDALVLRGLRGRKRILRDVSG